MAWSATALASAPVSDPSQAVAAASDVSVLGFSSQAITGDGEKRDLMASSSETVALATLVTPSRLYIAVFSFILFLSK
jgi:hypothetical protein